MEEAGADPAEKGRCGVSLNESTVEAAALEWFEELGLAVAFGPDLAPGEPRTERGSFGDVVPMARLCEA